LDQWLFKKELVDNEPAGMQRIQTGDQLTVADLCNRFLAEKTAQLPMETAKQERRVRRFRLWPETIEAINALPKSKEGLVFQSQSGATLIPAGRHNPISKGFRKWADNAKH
jgi:hypothetical protein